jgi:hypothetical protein
MMVDPVIEHLLDRGLALTRENYIALAYTEDAPELDAESEAIVRQALAKGRAVQLAAKLAILRARRRR